MYKGKIIVNEKKRMIHTEECWCIIENGDGYRTFRGLQTALLDCRQKLKVCKHCLKNDLELQQLVEERNQNLKRTRGGNKSWQ